MHGSIVNLRCQVLGVTPEVGQAAQVPISTIPGVPESDLKASYWERNWEILGEPIGKMYHDRFAVMEEDGALVGVSRAIMPCGRVVYLKTIHPFPQVSGAFGKKLSKFSKKAYQSMKKKHKKVFRNKAFQYGAAAVATYYGGPKSGRAVRKGLDKLGKRGLAKYAQNSVAPAAQALGVPPWATISATAILSDAMAGNSQALAKIENAAMQAQGGNPAAMQAVDLFSMLYRGGLDEMKHTGKIPTHPGAVPFALPSAEIEIPTLAPVPPDLLQAFYRIQSKKYGTKPAAVSGWLYNVPYRSPMAALAMDKSNPSVIARHLYSEGLRA